MPQHRLPTLGQGEEGTGDQRTLQSLQRGVDEGLAGVVTVHVIRDDLTLLPSSPVVGGVTYRGEQVGTEGVTRPSPTLNDTEHLGERLGHGVLGLGLHAQQLTGQAARGGRMALVEGPEGRVVTGPDPRDDLGVAEQCLGVITLGVGHSTPFHSWTGPAPVPAADREHGFGVRNHVLEKISLIRVMTATRLRDQG